MLVLCVHCLLMISLQINVCFYNYLCRVKDINQHFVFDTDETYRVGLMCESKSGSDYINASFVNVSGDVRVVHTHAKFKWFGSILWCLFTYTGLPAERCLHSDSGSTGEHSGGLLEDDVGVPVWLYRDALSAGRRLSGLYTNTHTL